MPRDELLNEGQVAEILVRRGRGLGGESMITSSSGPCSLSLPGSPAGGRYTPAPGLLKVPSDKPNPQFGPLPPCQRSRDRPIRGGHNKC